MHALTGTLDFRKKRKGQGTDGSVEKKSKGENTEEKALKVPYHPVPGLKVFVFL